MGSEINNDQEKLTEETAAQEIASDSPADEELSGGETADEQFAEEEDLFEDVIPAEEHPARSFRKKKKMMRTAIIVILSVLALLIGGGIYLINHYLNMIRRVESSDESLLSPSEIEMLESKYWASVNGETETDAPDTTEMPGTIEVDPTNPPEIRVLRLPYQADAYRSTLSADDEQVIFDHPVTPTWVDPGPLKDEELINIMLVGQDTRNTGYRERSDSMILVSINPKTHKVALISFLRDIYAPMGGDYGNNRLNIAFQIGGPSYMYKVFENFFGLHIDGCVYVNFGQFMNLVNLLGGVDVTLSDTEAKYLKYTLEQSVPDMRYWGQIVEAQMPEIKAGTSVEEAIRLLANANLQYGYTDAHGGAAPVDLKKAKVVSLWTNTAGTTAAKTGKYYPLQSTIYITYSETMISFPRIDANTSVASAETLLKNSGFNVAYADKNGNLAPVDSRSALVTKVSLDAAGKNVPAAGDKFAEGTKIYITYNETKATVPSIPAGTTVSDAETLLNTAGFNVSWTNAVGGVAPADKTKAVVTGIYSDRAATKPVQAGDKLDVNTTLYLSYETVPDKLVMPAIAIGQETVSSAVQKLEAAGFTVAYADANGGQAPQDAGTATVTKVTSDAAGSNAAAADSQWDAGTVMYVSYDEQEPSSEEPPTVPSSEDPQAVMPVIEAGDTVENAEALLTAAGFYYAYSAENGGVAPADKTTATVVKITDASGNTVQAGSQWPLHTTMFINYAEQQPSSEDPTETESSSETLPEESSSSEEETPEESPEESTESETQDPGRSGEDLTVGPGTAFRAPAYIPSLQVTSVYSRTVSAMSQTTASSDDDSLPYYLRGIHEGTVHLDGMQALAYCRMRKLDSDFKRTERQRVVLNYLFNKIKSSNLATLNNLLNEMLPQVTTDLSNAEIIRIASIVLPYFSSINLNLYSIPAPGTWMPATIDGRSVISINQAGNIAALRNWLPF